MMRKLKRIAIGIGFAPFHWQWGDISLGWWDNQRMHACGPLRLAWRGWS